ncbi:hypothetical protein CR105_16060 [Massilia eurypsychrophila]|uniref:Uncharacterized protein n=1 Tax=Massilia eurypsychrophila TaxID=1485217 RepID=A0A2G8TCT6_9BURK|nr:hypothetical protein [Massilia eurypsychrophila]PIL43866.1 hypothetical protein CR105_16060 [Massilia eurypsychrophila]
MTKPKNAAGQPAGDGTPYVSASQIALLIEVAALALHDHRQQLAVNEAHRKYIEALNSYEGKHGPVEGRLDPRNPDHAPIIAATKGKYEKHQAEKRKAYNIRRRLQTACRKARHLNADRAAGSVQ